MIDKDEFEGQLDRLLDQRARFERARIDAGACQTQRDWDDYHVQMDRFHDMRDAFLERYLPYVTAVLPTTALTWERPAEG